MQNNKIDSSENQKVNSSNRSISISNIIIGLVLLILFIIAYFPVWKSLISKWSESEEYSHGFLIIPICLYILWQKRDILVVLEPKPSNFGLVGIFAAMALYLFGSFAGVDTIASVSMIPFIAGIVAYLLGLTFLSETLFPILFLLFLIPIPAQIYAALTIPLQLLVSKLSVLIISKFGMTIFREGNLIHLPDKTLQVVEACSGLRSLVSLLMLSAIFGYMTLKSNFLRLVLFFSGIPTAIFVNILRVILIAVFFYYLQLDLTAGKVHTLIGVLLFILSIFLIYLVKGFISNWDK